MFEQIYSPQWLNEKPYFGYLLGLVFALFGIFSAKLIFGSNPGMMSVAFTAILLMPILNKLITITESNEIREKKFSLPLLIKDHKNLFIIYTYIFLGILTTYAFFTMVWTKAFSLNFLEPQLKVANITGNAINTSFFVSIFKNNINVLIVCFLLSFFYGSGSVLFLAWNASVWGAVFGFIARESASQSHTNPFMAFGCLMIPVLPHMITEAASYFSASIVGGVVSKAVLKEKWMSERFKHVITDALIFFVLAIILIIIAAWLEVYIFPMIPSC